MMANLGAPAALPLSAPRLPAVLRPDPVAPLLSPVALRIPVFVPQALARPVAPAGPAVAKPVPLLGTGPRVITLRGG
ncbi:hypothetical protein [Dankookia sp. P2]|uniref:hypothetical protein n=1 Tax=Dankookia sp. P2 TaxID=3423955 RepID=UPI003D66B863